MKKQRTFRKRDLTVCIVLRILVIIAIKILIILAITLYMSFFSFFIQFSPCFILLQV